jgi:hypothetical protein
MPGPIIRDHRDNAAPWIPVIPKYDYGVRWTLPLNSAPGQGGTTVTSTPRK